MIFPFVITYRNASPKTVWIDAENENDANEYSLNYWSDPEVTGVVLFVEPPVTEEYDDAEDARRYYQVMDNLPDDEQNTR